MWQHWLQSGGGTEQVQRPKERHDTVEERWRASGGREHAPARLWAGRLRPGRGQELTRREGQWQCKDEKQSKCRNAHLTDLTFWLKWLTFQEFGYFKERRDRQRCSSVTGHTAMKTGAREKPAPVGLHLNAALRTSVGCEASEPGQPRAARRQPHSCAWALSGAHRAPEGCVYNCEDCAWESGNTWRWPAGKRRLRAESCRPQCLNELKKVHITGL